MVGEDLGLDQPAVTCRLDGGADARKLDHAIAHHAAVV
jgi:hypothetical protein